MLESIISVSLIGLIAGMVYSMPIAGPVSIIIVSKALEGKLRFCQRTAIGASSIEFIYVFIVVYGITALYTYYQPIIPYLLFVGGIIVSAVAIRIMRHKIDLDSFNSAKISTDKIENKGGMRTGIILNLTNPTLFISWLMASFITLSFASSLGINTGGLDLVVNENVNSVSEIAGNELKAIDNLNQQNLNPEERSDSPPIIIISLAFALSVGIGALLWLDQLARFIIQHRDKIKVKLLNKLIHFMGIFLFGIGIYLGYKAIFIFFSH